MLATNNGEIHKFTMAKDEEPKPHIVAIPYPAQGHLPPVLHLSKVLAAQGFAVTVLNVDSIHRALLSKASSLSPGLDVRYEKFDFGLEIPYGMDAANHKELLNWVSMCSSSKQSVEGFLRALKPAPCCIIIDWAWTWSLKDLGIPIAMFSPGSAAWMCLEKHGNLLADKGYAFQGPQSHNETIIDFLPGIEGLQVRDIPDYYSRPELQNTIMQNVGRIYQSDWVLVNSMVELEPKTFLENENFIAIGPLFPLQNETHQEGILREVNNECLEWLESRETGSVLYISFGSLSVTSGPTFQELAAGLEASGQPFLWVVREDMVQLPDGFMDGFLQRTRKHGLVVTWAPQLEVLAHSSIGGFLSHCGWNSIMESLCNGVPILGWPYHSEQSMNCSMLEISGLGLRFSRNEVAIKDEVAEMISFFMGDNENMLRMRSRVSAIKEAARVTTAPGGSSYLNMLKFVAALKRA